MTRANGSADPAPKVMKPPSRAGYSQKVPADAVLTSIFLRERRHAYDRELPADEGANMVSRRQAVSVAKVTRMGLEDSSDWHKRPAGCGVLKTHEQLDRAISAQTSGNIAQLKAFEKTSAHLNEPLGDLPPGCFGENIFLDAGPAFTSAQVCVGDRFGVFRKGSQDPVCILQVTSPRCACPSVDDSLGRTPNEHGVGAFSGRTGCTGFFLRVAEILSFSCELRAGDEVRLLKRLHPTWNLERVSNLLYGSPTAALHATERRMAGLPAIEDHEFQGTTEELLELATIKELGTFLFRDEVLSLLERRGFTLPYLPHLFALVALCNAMALFSAAVAGVRGFADAL